MKHKRDASASHLTRIGRLAPLLMLLGTAALAQEPGSGDAPLNVIEVSPPSDSSDAQPEAASDTVQLEEVVVTAQKRKQSLQDVPVSVTAVDGSFIQDVAAADLSDVAQYVPNVRVDADDLGSPQLFIRGFGTNAFNPSFESSVGFVQDEIYFGRPGYFTESMFDIDRVEVLRGPQGTLFGKNTIAGVFNVTTRGPSDSFGGDLRYTYGEYNSHRVEGGLGGMFADWGGARVSGLYRSEDGQLYNQFLDRDEEKLEQRAGRMKLRFYPSDSVTMELLVQGSDTDAAFWPFQLYRLDQDTRNYLSSFDPNIEDDPYNFRTSFDTRGYIEKGSETAALNTQWAIGDLGGLHDANAVLVLAGSKFRIDQLNELDVSPADISRLDNHEDHEQFSAELRFSANADSLFGLGEKVEFVGGAFYYDAKYTLLAQIEAGADIGSYLLTDDFLQLASGDGGLGIFGGLGLPGIPLLGEITAPLVGEDYYQFDYTQKTRSIAGFGQMTWYLTSHWAITPGVRVNFEEKDIDTAGNQNCALAPIGGAIDTTVCVMATLLEASDYNLQGLKRDESDVSPKLTLQYFGDNGVNLYASYARGYKSGGYNSLSFNGEDLEFKPETAETYELGIKSTFFDRTLRFNATVYETHFKDLQVLAFNGVFFDVSNAASATSRGLEADATWITPFEPLRIMASVGLLDATYDEYRDAPAPVRNANGELQLGAQQDLSGGQIAFAPKTTATITPMLSFPVFHLVGRLAGDIIYTGSQYTDTDLDPNTRVDAYTRYSARFTLSNQDESWSLTLGGSNLSDERVLNQVTDATFFPGTYFAQQAAGRQLFAALAINL